MGLRWEKVGRRVGMEGTTTIYVATDTRITIESRKRHIPYAKGSWKSGTWEHTSFFVLEAGEELAEKYSLTDAKRFAETLCMKRAVVTDLLGETVC